tara:strand:+ start:26310 stop:26717 length:408 start_codon:yes stop_codon:yes gene_type:complete
MNENVIFFYDGKCPFCSKFAELIELKGSIPNLKLKNARASENLPQLTSLYKQGYNLNKGAILIKDNDILHGAIAINWICKQLSEPSDALLETIRVLFHSQARTKLIFPLLIWSRRFILLFKGVSWEPIKDNVHFY